MSDKQNQIVKSVVLSIFDDDGPTPTVYWPIDMDEASRLLIAISNHENYKKYTS